jgi:hypothetical protein
MDRLRQDGDLGPTPIRLTIIRTNRGAGTQDLSPRNLRFGRFRKRRERSHDTQREILRALSQIDFAGSNLNF